MADENAKIDQNREKSMLAVTDNVAAEIRRLLVDPITGRLKVSATISGGSTPLTTKGDILTYTTEEVRLGVGSNGQVIEADSTQPEGIKWVTPTGGGDLKADGTVPLTANWDVGAFTITALTFTSDVATGTAPFTVASTTEVANLRSATATILATARTIGGVSFDGSANITVATATGGFTISGGNLALGANSITITGSIGTTGARVTKGWFTDLQVTNAIAGSITGNAATVTTITGLAPDTATTQAVQANITTCVALVSIQGLTITLADAGADAILGWDDTASAYENLTQAEVLAIIGDSSLTAKGVVELATIAEIDIGTDSTKAIPVDQFVASKRNIRWLSFILVEAGTNCAIATNIAGDWVSPIAGTILQSDTTPFFLYATNSIAGINTGVGLVVDISIGGTTIMTTNKLDFDTTEKTTTTASTPPDLTTTSLAVGNILTFDIDSIHDGTAAKGLTVYMAIRE